MERPDERSIKIDDFFVYSLTKNYAKESVQIEHSQYQC